MASWRSMTKIAGSGSTPKCHGSATLVSDDLLPDPAREKQWFDTVGNFKSVRGPVIYFDVSEAYLMHFKFLCWTLNCSLQIHFVPLGGGGGSDTSPETVYLNFMEPWASSFKPFKEPRNRFPTWRNRFLGSIKLICDKKNQKVTKIFVYFTTAQTQQKVTVLALRVLIKLLSLQ